MQFDVPCNGLTQTNVPSRVRFRMKPAYSSTEPAGRVCTPAPGSKSTSSV